LDEEGEYSVNLMAGLSLMVEVNRRYRKKKLQKQKEYAATRNQKQTENAFVIF
jgi:hypothetical protein